jgi:hypothetical protein
LYTREGNETFINPDPFIFKANLEQYKFFSNANRTCMLWCIENSNLCAGANMLDSDTWELSQNSSRSHISGNWRIVSPGRLVLLYSESSTALNGPSWFLSLSKR